MARSVQSWHLFGIGATHQLGTWDEYRLEGLARRVWGIFSHRLGRQDLRHIPGRQSHRKKGLSSAARPG